MQTIVNDNRDQETRILPTKLMVKGTYGDGQLGVGGHGRKPGVTVEER